MSQLKNRILDATQDDLAAIEKALEENLAPHLELVKEIASHILFSGGKRLRPLLMVLCARICGYRGNYDKTFSIIFEYLHAATLLHDDLVDDAGLRRGKPAAHAVFGNSMAVLTGDFLLARGLSLAAATGNPEVIRVIARITEEMSQGEIYQLSRKGSLDLEESEYREIIRCKTAVLFQGACHISALLAETSEDKAGALSDYGHHLGMAFQIADDLLDYTSQSRHLGKLVGADLREGKLTLPVIHALKNVTDENRRFMESIIQNPSFSPDEFEQLIQLLEQSGGIEYARQCADAHVKKAKAGLEIFPVSDTKQILVDLADYALARKI